MHKYIVTFKLRTLSNIHHVFDATLEFENFTLRTTQGEIWGTTTIEKDNINLAREEITSKLDELASLFTIIRKVGFIFTIEDIRFTQQPTIITGGKHTLVQFQESLSFAESDYESCRISQDELKELGSKLKNLKNKIYQLKDGKEILRAVKWWRKGNLEGDKVDKFLDYFIAFEILASIKGYKSSYGEKWAEQFCRDYSITHKLDGMTITRIRNYIMHAPGPEKDKAEELAERYGEKFGQEVFKAIERLSSSISPFST